MTLYLEGVCYASKTHSYNIIVTAFNSIKKISEVLPFKGSISMDPFLSSFTNKYIVVGSNSRHL